MFLLSPLIIELMKSALKLLMYLVMANQNVFLYRSKHTEQIFSLWETVSFVCKKGNGIHSKLMKE